MNRNHTSPPRPSSLVGQERRNLSSHGTNSTARDCAAWRPDSRSEKLESVAMCRQTNMRPYSIDLDRHEDRSIVADRHLTAPTVLRARGKNSPRGPRQDGEARRSPVPPLDQLRAPPARGTLFAPQRARLPSCRLDIVAATLLQLCVRHAPKVLKNR